MEKLIIFILIMSFSLQAVLAEAYVYETSFEPGENFDLGASYGGHAELVTAPEPVHSGSYSAHNWGFKSRFFTADSSVVILGTYTYTNVTTGVESDVENAIYSGSDYYAASAGSGDPVYITLEEAQATGLYDGETPIDMTGEYWWEFSHLLIKNYTLDGKQDGYSWKYAYPRGRIGPQGYDTIGSFEELYMRIYVNYKQLEGYHQLLRFFGSSVYIATVTVSGGSTRLAMGDTQYNSWYPIDSGGNIVNEINNYSIGMSLNEWHYVELYFKKSSPGVYNGGGRVWIDGNLVIDRMDLDTSTAPNIATIVTGLVLTNNQLEFYVDDWVVDTEYIGPSTPSSSYCGDGNCDAGETCSNCQSDCGTCPAVGPIVSGSLRDENNNPVSADITIYQEGSNTVVEETNTDALGSYSLSVPSSVYDVLYDINDFFINNFWIKLLSLDLSTDMVDKLTGVTGDSSNNRVSFSVDIPLDQTIQTYSSTEPEKVSIGGTYINKVSSLTSLTDNTWFYDSASKILYIKASPSGGTPPPTGILFQDDFSSDLSKWEIISGDWSHYWDGRLRRDGSGSYIKSNTGDTWTDYSFQAVLSSAVSYHHLGMLVRVVDNENYYRIQYYVGSSSNTIKIIRLYKIVNGIETQLTSTDVDYTLPSTAKVEVADEGSGVRIKVYMNDVLELNYLENPRTFSAGRIGFNGGYSDALYDDVVVTGTGDGGGTYCGDGNCDAGETCSNCQSDCGVCTVECNDGMDNDGDGNTDYPADSGCSSSSDSDESNCSDGACEGGETCSSCSSDCGECSEGIVIHFEDGFENDAVGTYFTWTPDDSPVSYGLYGDWGADISAGDDVPDPDSYFEVVTDHVEGTRSLKGFFYGSATHRFDLLMSPTPNYASEITDAIYVSWYQKFESWQPSYKEMKIFKMGRYTNPPQRFVMQLNNPGVGSFTRLYNNGATYSAGSFNLQLNVWNHIEIASYESNNGDGFYKAWVNGVQVLNEENLNNNITTNKQFEIGVEMAVNPGTVTNDIVFYLDDIQVGNYVSGT